MYNRLQKLLEGWTTGRDPISTGDRVGNFLKISLSKQLTLRQKQLKNKRIKRQGMGASSTSNRAHRIGSKIALRAIKAQPKLTGIGKMVRNAYSKTVDKHLGYDY